MIGVWSTAERRSTIVRGIGTRTGSGDFVQVSRLGNPLVNEVVINLELKDTFNGAPPSVDRTVPEIVARVTDPELGRLIEQLYPGVDVPSAPRDDLVAVFLTGIEGLNQQVNSRATPSEQLRLNTAIRPTAEICRGNVLGVLGGDDAGFPNGRRIEDDVTDIEIRAVAGGYALTPSFNHSPNNQLGDGLSQNDLPCLSRFPYLATPHQGYEHDHHREGDDDTAGDNGNDNDNAVAGVEKKQIEDDDDDDQERKLTEEQQQQKQRTNRSNRSDYLTEGNVVGVRCDLAAPVPTVAVGFIAAPEDVPYALIALVDGVQQVRLRAEAAGQCGAIRLGDYLFADGTKENEQLFDAESVEVRRNGRRIS